MVLPQQCGLRGLATEAAAQGLACAGSSAGTAARWQPPGPAAPASGCSERLPHTCRPDERAVCRAAGQEWSGERSSHAGARSAPAPAPPGWWRLPASAGAARFLATGQPSTVAHRSHRAATAAAAAAMAAAADAPPLPRVTGGDAEPAMVLERATAFAPATVANLGPGFDFLGCAVQGLGDHVVAEVRGDVAAGEVVIADISGDGGRLSRAAGENCVGIAARATLELLGVTSVGLALTLRKGLPLGSGLGSSAASAAAAAVAVNALFGSPVSKADLVLAGLKSEATVSGYHADNVAPAILGGFVLVRSYAPLELIKLPFPAARPVFFVVASPTFEAPTREMRAALPKEVSLKAHVANSSQAAALVAAILTGDVRMLGSALALDTIVEPRRSPLIPGMAAVKVAAHATGAYGCTISGGGPTAVAVTDSREKGERIGRAMVEAFLAQGKLQATFSVQELDREGARVVS